MAQPRAKPPCRRHILLNRRIGVTPQLKILPELVKRRLREGFGVSTLCGTSGVKVKHGCLPFCMGQVKKHPLLCSPYQVKKRLRYQETDAM
jgi:hypothetical protein